MLNYLDISHMDKEPSELKRKAFSFLFSLLLHSIFLYLAFHYKVTVKIYPQQEKIREVILVSPEEIFIPQNIEDLRKIPPETELDEMSQYRRTKTSVRNERETSEERRAGLETDREQKLNQGNYEKSSNKAGSLASPSDFPTKFRLDFGSKPREDLPLGSTLDLSQIFQRTKKAFKDTDRGQAREDLNLLKYIYPDSSNTRRTGTKPSQGGSGRRPSPTRLTASLNIKTYDLTPWAEKVVSIIQKSWAIPSQKMSMKATVGISVMIEKNGELLSAEIVNSSNIPSLDQAALQALYLSSPFPGLPDDFPDKNIEVYFLFDYND